MSVVVGGRAVVSLRSGCEATRPNHKRQPCSSLLQVSDCRSCSPDIATVTVTGVFGRRGDDGRNAETWLAVEVIVEDATVFGERVTDQRDKQFIAWTRGHMRKSKLRPSRSVPG